jgi:hypothetical protein
VDLQVCLSQGVAVIQPDRLLWLYQNCNKIFLHAAARNCLTRTLRIEFAHVQPDPERIKICHKQFCRFWAEERLAQGNRRATV